MNTKPPDHTDLMLATALKYAQRGWNIFPNNNPTIDEDGSISCSCHQGEKCPERSRGKHPRLKGWQKKATTNTLQLKRWWSTWPGSNIGIATGYESNILVLDIDAGAGEENLDILLSQGNSLPQTVTVITGGGGRQYYYRYPDVDFDPANAAGLCGLTGIDIRTDGGQVVAPPSLHRSGIQYKWAPGCSPDEIPLDAPPDWLVEMMRRDGKPRTGPRCPRSETTIPPSAHIEYLHKFLNPRLVKTRNGISRRNLDKTLGQSWQEQPLNYSLERHIITTIQNLWLPPKVRSYQGEDGQIYTGETTILNYEQLSRGGTTTKTIAGGRWIKDFNFNKYHPSICSIKPMLKLLLGQIRLSVPWDSHIDSWGNETERVELDTILLPMKILGADKTAIDIWAASPEQRATLIKPFIEAIEAISTIAESDFPISYWAEGSNEIWLAIHASEHHPREVLVELRNTLIDMAVQMHPHITIQNEHTRLWSNSTSINLTYRIGLGNLSASPCPLPFSFHPAYPDRMLMAFNPHTGQWHDQVEYLLSLHRQSLSPVISTLPELAQETGLYNQARRRAMEQMGLQGKYSEERITKELNTPVGRAFLAQAESDLGCRFTSLSHPPHKRPGVDEINLCTGRGDAAAPSSAVLPLISDISLDSHEMKGLFHDEHTRSENTVASSSVIKNANLHEMTVKLFEDLDRLKFVNTEQCANIPEASSSVITGNLSSESINRLIDSTIYESGQTENTNLPKLQIPTNPPPNNPTNIVGHKFGVDSWHSYLPAIIPGLYSTMIGSGVLARTLAVMRDDNLIDDAIPGTGILLELEDEVIHRYCGKASNEDARLELREFVKFALPNLDSFHAGGIHLTLAQQEGCQRLAESIHPRLSTRGSRAPITVDSINSLLQIIVIKSQFRRQATWTLDHIGIQADWADDIGTEGVSRISRADRNRISRFLGRICLDYHRDANGKINPDATPPLVTLIRCERKGFQGTPSLYTFLWENWGEEFSDLCITPCPDARGDRDLDDEMMSLGLLKERSG